MSPPAVNTDKCYKTPCHKQPFEFKTCTSNNNIDDQNQTLLTIHHKINSGQKSTHQTIRFLHATFNITGELFAVLNHLGNIYVFDFALSKYWLLAHENCSIIKFIHNSNERTKEVLLAGATIGDVHVFNAQTSKLISDLHGHKHPVNDISFSDNNRCVTLAANHEAIIWRLETYTKLQILQLEEGAFLKFVLFVPVSCDILACFKDDTVQIWKSKNYQPSKQILAENIPGSFNKLVIRSIAFTSNGKQMLIVGNSSTIYVFNVESMSLKKELTINDSPHQCTIKKVEFLPLPVPNLGDDTNKLLVLLTSNGTLYFYNIETETIFNKIADDNALWKFAVDPSSDKIATITRTNGHVQVHSLNQILAKMKKRKTRASFFHSKAAKTRDKNAKRNSKINAQLSEILNPDKLKAILKQFGEYPSLYRRIIWTHLLQLPKDEQQYEAVTRNVYASNFDDFEHNYPLEVKQDLKNLKLILGNLVSWCPFLSSVNYLPLLVFPFVKFLQAEPVVCFETILSVLINHCQYWFEYHPVPPLNIIGLVESILIQRDAQLFEHFKDKAVNGRTYAWYLLQSVFSEVLPTEDWLVFWDHLFSNEPAFLIVAVPAFAMTNRATLLTLQHADDFEFHFRSVGTIDFKRFIRNCYKLLNDASLENHPRTFLMPFKPFETGYYPVFDQYPRNCLEVCDSINNLRSQTNKDLIQSEVAFAHLKSVEVERLDELQRCSEEQLRQIELNNLYKEKLDEETANAEMQKMRVQAVQSRMQAKERELTNQMKQNYYKNQSNLDLIRRKQVEAQRETVDAFGKVEEDLLKHYTNLLKHKIQIEGLIDEDVSLDFVQLKRSYKELADEINRTQSRISVPSKEYLKQLNVATGLAAVDSLIEKVEAKISGRSTTLDRYQTKYMVHKLALESEELSEEINKLLLLLAESK